MDQLPFPEQKKKIDLQLYFDAWKNRHGESTISVSTMRGCPYTCKWCSRAVYGQSYRRRSAVKVVDELQTLQSAYQFDTIWFCGWCIYNQSCLVAEFRDEIVRGEKSLFVLNASREQTGWMIWPFVYSKKADVSGFGSERKADHKTILDAMDRRVKVEQVGEMIRKSKSAGIQTELLSW